MTIERRIWITAPILILCAVGLEMVLFRSSYQVGRGINWGLAGGQQASTTDGPVEGLALWQRE
jgi:hypothetical protein